MRKGPECVWRQTIGSVQVSCYLLKAPLEAVTQLQYEVVEKTFALVHQAYYIHHDLRMIFRTGECFDLYDSGQVPSLPLYSVKVNSSTTQGKKGGKLPP